MISNYIISKAIQYEIIKESEKQLYEISLSTLLFSGLNWGTLLAFGVFHGCLRGCLLFMVTYIPLRVFSGGLHLSTKVRCYCFSLLVFFCMIKLYEQRLYESTTYEIVLIVSVLVIAILSPKEDKKKPLSIREHARNKKIVLLILICEIILILIFRFLGRFNAFFFSSFSFVLMLMQLLLGEIRSVVLSRFKK